MKSIPFNTISPTLRLLLTDSLVFGLALLLPALSHILPIPLYYLDPMKLLVITAWIISRNTYNVVCMALAIPLFSMWVTGHPTFYKAILISFELISMTVLFLYFYKRGISAYVSIFIGILISKILYYTFKYWWINIGFIDGTLISTPLWIQGCITAFLTLVLGTMIFITDRKKT